MKLEELLKNEKFQKLADMVRKFVKLCKKSSVERYVTERGFTETRKLCYRVLRRPIDELKMWEMYGKWDTEKSFYKRFVCTANKYLAWLLKELVKKDLAPPPFYKPPEVMLEVETNSRICVCYSCASVGAYPVIHGHSPYSARDVWVSQKDLLLAECYTEHDVPIEKIRRIYVDPEAEEETKKFVEEFCKKHGIELVWGFPEPDEESKKLMLELANYLAERSRKCMCTWSTIPPDPIVSALAEIYDQEFHKDEPLTLRCSCPIGASDAIYEHNKRARMSKFYSRKFGCEDPPETCDVP